MLNKHDLIPPNDWINNVECKLENEEYFIAVIEIILAILNFVTKYDNPLVLLLSNSQ